MRFFDGHCFDINTLIITLSRGEIPENDRFLWIREYYDRYSANAAQELASIVGRITETLSSGSCKKGLSIDLQFINLNTPNVVSAITDALLTGKCPENLTLNLKTPDFSISTENFVLIANAIASGKCPKGLRLILNKEIDGHTSYPYQPHPCDNDFEQKVGILLGAISSGHCPENFILDIGCDRRLNADAFICDHLAPTLETGQCPKGLTIDLNRTRITIIGFRRLAQALRSGKCPENLFLNFDCCEHSAESIGAFKDAVISGKAPKGLKLDIADGAPDRLRTYQSILEEMLSSEACPYGMKILYINLDETAQLDEICEARDQKIRRATLTLHQPTRDYCYSTVNGKKRILHARILPLELINFILTFLFVGVPTRQVFNVYRALHLERKPYTALILEEKNRLELIEEETEQLNILTTSNENAKKGILLNTQTARDRFFREHFSSLKKSSFWYEKDLKQVSMDQLIDHALGKNSGWLGHSGADTKKALMSYGVDFAELAQISLAGFSSTDYVCEKINSKPGVLVTSKMIQHTQS